MRVVTPSGTLEAVEVRMLADERFAYRAQGSPDEWVTASYRYAPGVAHMPFLWIEANGGKILLVHVRERDFGADLFTIPAGNARTDTVGADLMVDSVHGVRVGISGPGSDASLSVSEARPAKSR
jgi:hypothetical protein